MLADMLAFIAGETTGNFMIAEDMLATIAEEKTGQFIIESVRINLGR